MVHIRLENASFRYPIYEMAGRSLKVSLFRQMAGGSVAARSGVVEVEAIRDLSFELRAGDRLGLIGRNGSGKSTLLRLLAGLAYPQNGKLSITGRVIPLIEKGLGVNAELSGASNIELPLRLLGATTAEVKLAKQQIPEFTGLGPFIDLPVRTYSEGMKARLMFAICTSLDADILLLDEWLSAGDVDFVERAEQRLTAMIARTKIVVLASHDLNLIQHACTLAAWMEGGRLMMLGPPDQVIESYLSGVHNARPVTPAPSRAVAAE
jgi:lipopolysaccharide transport system ATP-binding protein